MTAQKTELQQAKANALKAFRTAIRLKHMIAADTEINDRLPAYEAMIDQALADGQPLELSPGEAFDSA